MKRSVLKGLMAVAFSAVLLLGCGAKGAADSADKPKDTAGAAASAAVTETEPEALDASKESEAMDAGTESEAAATEASNERAVPEGMQEIAIGTMDYSIIVPSDYYEGEVTDADKKDNQLVYYKSDKHQMDFDIYQFDKEGKTLDEITMEEVEEYNSNGFETVFPNDLTVKLYYSEEEFEGKKYKVANYLFENEKDFGKISFWLDGDDAEELVEQIINTLEWKNQPKSEIKTGEITTDFDPSDIDLDALEAQMKEAAKNAPAPTLNKKDSSEDVNEVEGGLFITKDKVECRSVSVGVANNIFNFGIELYNETDKDLTFDPTKFSLEMEDGTLVDPFALSGEESLDVKTEFKRLWMAYTIYDPKGLKVGDSVSIYYDGVFITKVNVEEK